MNNKKGVITVRIYLMVVGIVLALCPSISVAQEVKNREVTVYNINLALIKETRTVNLKKGMNRVEIQEIATDIDSTSVRIVPLSDPSIKVIDQNFQYDLLSESKLLEKYIGKRIKVITRDGKAEEGYLVGGYQLQREWRDGEYRTMRYWPNLIIAEDPAKGPVKILRWDTQSISQILLPQIPEGLRSTPVLVWNLESEKEGKQEIQLSYLTRGMEWRADYALTLSAEERSVDLSGWITLRNNCGLSFKGVNLKLIAGDVYRPPTERYYLTAEGPPIGGPVPVPQFTERTFFEYHLYDLQRKVDVENNETKQIEFVTASKVPVSKLYIYDGARYDLSRIYDSWYRRNEEFGLESHNKVYVAISLENSKENNLGIPLPRGTIRVYKADDSGSPQFVGENIIDHTPKDERIEIRIGDAFDLVGERRRTNFRRIAENVTEESYEIKVRNHKEVPVTVKVVEHLYRSVDWTIIQSSQEYVKKDAQTINFILEIPKGGEGSLTYTVRYRFF